MNINERLNKLSNDVIRFYADNKLWFGYLLLISVVSYAFSLTSFSFAIDQELQVMATQPDKVLLGLGRWGAYLLNRILFPNPVMPFIPLFVTLIFSALGFSIVTRIISDKRTFADYLAAPIFIAFPTLFYIYVFNTISFAFGFGLFVSAAAIYMLVKKGKYHRLFSILLAALAISMYQSMLTVLAVIFLLYLLAQIINHEISSFKEVISLVKKFSLMIIYALIIYYAIEYLCLFIFDMQHSDYVLSYCKISASYAYWIHAIGNIFCQASQYYSGAEHIYARNFTLLLLLFVYVCTTIIYLIFSTRKKTGNLKCVALVIFLLMLLTPFALNIMDNGWMPVRVVTSSFPLVISGLVLLSWQNEVPLARFFLILLVVVCSYNFIVINNKFAFANYLSWQADQALTVRLLNNLDAVRPSSISMDAKNDAIPLAEFGYYARKTSGYMMPEHETIGASFYAWDRGNIHRMITFMNTMGIFEYKPATEEQKNSIAAQASKLPVWPNKGSTTFINGIAVINFGDHPELK